MSDNNTDYVSTGAPKISGYAYRAPVGTVLPMDATTSLDSAFISLGFISEDGVKNNNSPETEDIKDWGGTTVISPQTSKDDTWQFILIESKNTEVLKTIYGDDNVSGDLTTGITIKANNTELEYASYVFDMVMRGGTKKRVVLPNAKVTDVGEIAYTRSDAIGYDTTLTCSADDEGNTHYEYMIDPTTDETTTDETTTDETAAEE